MQGLRTLYMDTGRAAAWRPRLVEAIIPEFVDPVSAGPLPGLEEQWSTACAWPGRSATGQRPSVYSTRT